MFLKVTGWAWLGSRHKGGLPCVMLLGPRVSYLKDPLLQACLKQGSRTTCLLKSLVTCYVAPINMLQAGYLVPSCTERGGMSQGSARRHVDIASRDLLQTPLHSGTGCARRTARCPSSLWLHPPSPIGWTPIGLSARMTSGAAAGMPSASSSMPLTTSWRMLQCCVTCIVRL